MSASLLFLGVALLSLVVDVGAIIIGNGDVIIGVNPEADLNTPWVDVFGLGATDPIGINYVGLRDGSAMYASTEPGCLCEGWGAGARDDPITPTFSYSLWSNKNDGADMSSDKSIVGTDGGTSVVVTNKDTTGNMKVVHDYHTTVATTYAIECTVTITNIGTDDWPSVRYKRVMDWDIYPTAFSEYVTIFGWGATSLYRCHDNGFEDADPWYEGGAQNPACPVNADFEDCGPSDHGASFIFEFTKDDATPYGPGESETFNIYYGTAGPTDFGGGSTGEQNAKSAISAVGGEVYSLGQQAADASGGDPFTFFFAFKGVGGEAICDDYYYLEVEGGITRDDAQAKCIELYGSNLASFTSEDQLNDCVCELIGEGAEPWVQLKGDHDGTPPGFYFPDGTNCPVGAPLCVSESLWCDGSPLGCNNPSSAECVYVSDGCCLKNDVLCGDTRNAILCEASTPE